MRIVLFGYRFHPFTLDIVEKFKEEDIKIKALVEAHPNYSVSKAEEFLDENIEHLKRLKMKYMLNKFVFKKMIFHPLTALKFGLPLLKRNGKDDEEVDLFNDIDFYKVGDHSDKKSGRILEDLSPDLIIFCPASGIIKKNILEIPKIGSLNAHMGPLPEIRGMNALEWSVFEKGDGYISVHFADEGVDTGDILKVKEVPLKNFNSISKLRKYARDRMALEIVNVVKEIKSSDYEVKKQSEEEGKQYFEMHKKLLDLTEKKLQKS